MTDPVTEGRTNQKQCASIIRSGGIKITGKVKACGHIIYKQTERPKNMPGSFNPRDIKMLENLKTSHPCPEVIAFCPPIYTATGGDSVLLASRVQ